MPHRQTILLVDDSENDLLFMRRAFKKAQSSIPLQEVCNGEEAIAYLKGDGLYSDRNKFPLPRMVLLDLNMPKKDGFEVLTWVRAQPVLKRLAIIVLSASTRAPDVDRAFDLGATSFLVKPSNLESLTAMVRCLDSWVKINEFPSVHDEKLR
jgi:CheY-like chemotaxis protein